MPHTRRYMQKRSSSQTFAMITDTCTQEAGKGERGTLDVFRRACQKVETS